MSQVSDRIRALLAEHDEAEASARRLDAAVAMCALTECARQEGANLNAAAMRMLSRALSETVYYCAPCRHVAESAVGLYVHLLACPSYRAEIDPAFAFPRPMGAVPVQCAVIGGISGKRCHGMAGHAGDHQFDAADVRSAPRTCGATVRDGISVHVCQRSGTHDAHVCHCGHQFLLSVADLVRAELEVKRPVERDA